VFIGEVAQAIGLSASAIRYYEARGIVPPAAERTPGGYRDYSDEEVVLLRFVKRLRSLGIPLDEIRGIVSLRTHGEAPCGPVREALDREVLVIDQQIGYLRRVQEELLRLKLHADSTVDHWPAHCVCDVLDEDADLRPTSEGTQVVLQYFDHCPNWQVVRRHLDYLGVKVRYQRIDTVEQAEELGFHGSPTILVDGVDPFAESDSKVGLACRIYRTPGGSAPSPTLEQLATAVSSARGPD